MYVYVCVSVCMRASVHVCVCVYACVSASVWCAVFSKVVVSQFESWLKAMKWQLDLIWLL